MLLLALVTVVSLAPSSGIIVVNVAPSSGITVVNVAPSSGIIVVSVAPSSGIADVSVAQQVCREDFSLQNSLYVWLEPQICYRPRYIYFLFISSFFSSQTCYFCEVELIEAM